MKKLLIAIVALMATTSLSAQDFRWGPTGGLNFAWVNDADHSSDCYVGFHAGVKGEFDLSSYIANGFYADARLIYSLKGGEWAGYHQNLGYLELPLNFGYRYDVSGEVSLMAGLGPYFGFGVVGKDVAKVDGAKIKSDIFGENYNRFDFGFNYNLGVELWDTWQFFLGFEHTVLNIAKSEYKDAYSGKVRTSAFYVGTAFMF